jgi:hypothetical protein
LDARGYKEVYKSVLSEWRVTYNRFNGFCQVLIKISLNQIFSDVVTYSKFEWSKNTGDGRGRKKEIEDFEMCNSI